jgi:hypothetical protein
VGREANCLCRWHTLFGEAPGEASVRSMMREAG